jgi:hypothetical protein
MDDDGTQRRDTASGVCRACELIVQIAVFALSGPVLVRCPIAWIETAAREALIK